LNRVRRSIHFPEEFLLIFTPRAASFSVMKTKIVPWYATVNSRAKMQLASRDAVVRVKPSSLLEELLGWVDWTRKDLERWTAQTPRRHGLLVWKGRQMMSVSVSTIP
jgi:hypothetical protein